MPGSEPEQIPGQITVCPDSSLFALIARVPGAGLPATDRRGSWLLVTGAGAGNRCRNWSGHRFLVIV
jgi:hypothetical protein